MLAGRRSSTGSTSSIRSLKRKTAGLTGIGVTNTHRLHFGTSTLVTRRKTLKYLPVVTIIALRSNAAPVAVRHTQGFLHGFIVLKDLQDKILASGDIIQSPAGDRVTSVMNLLFKDGSHWEETTVFSQRRTY